MKKNFHHDIVVGSVNTLKVISPQAQLRPCCQWVNKWVLITC